MLSINEIRNSDSEISQQFWATKEDKEIEQTATVKEVSDAFSMISDIQEGLAGGFISSETAIKQLNHVKQHLFNAQDAIDPESELRRNTMFVNGFMWSCHPNR